MKPGTAVRAAAARTLAAVIDGESLDRALQRQEAVLQGQDKALYQELCYGTLRFHPLLSALLDAMLDKALRARDRDIQALILLGLYQLIEMRIPAHAAVSATVDTAQVLGKPRLAGLVNAILRRFQRDEVVLRAALDDAAAHAHPGWLWRALGEHWGSFRDAIVSANNERPPMTLRVNLSRITRDAYLEQLAEAGIDARIGKLSETALTLTTPIDVERLPGFAQGLCSVQDEAAQLAATLLAPQPGERLLDACAAPGGKTGHLLEMQRGLASLTAMDRDPSRLARVEDNLLRLDLTARLLCADGADPPAELRELAPFDAILLDVPCSATGVIRRHPDIKLLRRAGDTAGFARQQRALLAGLWPLLAPGGRLLYVTCSLLPAENSEIIAWFLGETRDARESALTVAGAQHCRHGNQLLPGSGDWDGLYYCLLTKAQSGEADIGGRSIAS